MGKQNGTTDDLPFATKDGSPKTPTSATRGTDFTDPKNWTGQGPKNAQAYIPPQRPQRPEPVEGTNPAQPHQVQVPQQPVRDPSARVNMQEAGRGGPSMIDSASVAPRGGVQGTAHNPMKLHNPPYSVTGHGMGVSGSGSASSPSSASSASSASNPMTAWPSRAPTSSSDSKVRETDAIPKHRRK
jgi:hypothetical protein